MPNKNARKRARETMVFHHMRDVRDGVSVAPLPPLAHSDSGTEIDEQQYNAETGALYIRVDPDIEIADLETSVLNHPVGERSERKDLAHYFAWQLKYELSQPNAEIDRIPSEEIQHMHSILP